MGPLYIFFWELCFLPILRLRSFLTALRKLTRQWGMGSLLSPRAQAAVTPPFLLLQMTSRTAAKGHFCPRLAISLVLPPEIGQRIALLPDSTNLKEGGFLASLQANQDREGCRQDRIKTRCCLYPSSVSNSHPSPPHAQV